MPTKRNILNESNKSNDTAYFKVESALLRELGEQLVGSIDVAISELIKNSYDADALSCEIAWTDDELIVKDNGHGMSLEDFKKYWMTVGTSSKLKKKYSSKFKRDLTGSKGVGRFAVRFIGKFLELETIAINYKTGKKDKIIAYFDWQLIDNDDDITLIPIPYEIIEDVDDETGTILIIRDLTDSNKPDPEKVKKTKENVIAMTSPFDEFKKILPDSYQNKSKATKADPGFSVKFLNHDKDDSDVLSKEVLSYFVARVKIKPEGGKFRFTLEHKDKSTLMYNKLHGLGKSLSKNVYADIRFFPWREGVFSNKLIKAQPAKKFIENNCGVKIYDRLFRIKPYGIGDNDWLKLTHDKSRSLRRPRSKLGVKYLSMEDEVEKKPLLNWMLNLPTNGQITGAVFIQSDSTSGSDGLIPSMDRQGFVENEAFDELFELVRFALELIAKFDKDVILEKKKEENELKLQTTKNELRETIQIISASAGLNDEDKLRLIETYENAIENVTSVEQYDREARESLDVMGMLGVIAGFMTHEYQAALTKLQEVSTKLKKLGKKDKSFISYQQEIEDSISYFNDYIHYSQAYIHRSSKPSYDRWKVLPRVRHVVKTFFGFCSKRGIDVDYSEIPKDLLSPKISLVMYQGIIHNLYVNSIKALTSVHKEDKLVKIKAYDEDGSHIIEVLDNGPGIPDFLQDRIWDPLFTTTSNENNPLGSGMGLGLPLVKKVVESIGGQITLVRPPKGFSTLFKVKIPCKKQ